MAKQIERIEVPVENTTAKAVRLVEHGQASTLEFDVGEDKVLVNASELYAWLKEHYEGEKQANGILDGRHCICASSLY